MTARTGQIARSINSAVTFNVWDDWELIEEYAASNVVTAKYLQGAHGPIKSLVNNIYYFYQDELGSTSHITDATGHLLEYYKYDLYGKPTYWDASGNPLAGSNPLYNVRDLFSGERWMPEIGMYDLRNRFYLPDLGRFMQPDPIGFKGDSSNLYRYCGNDWASKTDPMGLDVTPDQPGFTIKLRDSLADAVGVDLLREIRLANTTAASSGQFNVQAQPVSVNKSALGASGSEATTLFRGGGKEHGSIDLDQQKSFGTPGPDGKVAPENWGPFKPDRVGNGEKAFKVTQTADGAMLRDKPGTWSQDFNRRAGSQIESRGAMPAAHFNPYGERIKVSAFRNRPNGSRDYLGSHTWSAVYNMRYPPHYEGTGRDWYPAEF
jgi:RHS repeat-associated protein